MANSMDAVSDRDFALEFLAAAAILATHMSRFAEEMVIWASAQFGFIKFSDAFSTGSSMMPQKRNPDAAELVRAKAGRIFGSLFTLLTVMKGLPLTYSKDMQEDKEAVFGAFDTLELCLAAMAGMVVDMKPDAARMKASASAGFTTATDLADWVTQKLNIPFRESHHITGRIVKLAEGKGCDLAELSLAEMQAAEPRITQEIFNVLTVEASAASRTSFGGTAPDNVRAQVEAARKRFLEKAL
jgi:argininosuccinate lyase